MPICSPVRMGAAGRHRARRWPDGAEAFRQAGASGAMIRARNLNFNEIVRLHTDNIVDVFPEHDLRTLATEVEADNNSYRRWPRNLLHDRYRASHSSPPLASENGKTDDLGASGSYRTAALIGFLHWPHRLGLRRGMAAAVDVVPVHSRPGRIHGPKQVCRPACVSCL